MADYVLAIDQGTTSSRAIVFNHSGEIVSTGQLEHDQIFPRAGWVEHNPEQIWNNVREAVGLALTRANVTHNDIAAVGITNQRETAVVWDKTTGKPVYNAIVWQDTRTQDIVDELSEDGGGDHVTDVTNASRTLFMDLETLQWDDEILGIFGVPRSMMPEIKSSSEVYGTVHSSQLLRETPVAGILGDQQAATFGQAAFETGEAKNTYGTGCFLIFNTGEEIVHSKNGLLTTVGYKLGDAKPHYALEGSIAVTGSLIQWLRDNLGMIGSAPEVETLAAAVEDNGGVYIVPAFSGLFAPYWRSDARGAIVGLTRFVNKNHIARAALEATAFQTREVLDAVNADSGVPLTELKVDGGMVANDALMQFQADILGVPVIRPKVVETTSLGAAYAAGLAGGFWKDLGECSANWAEDKRWEPQMDQVERERQMRLWKKAVSKSMDWVDDDVK